MASLAEWEAAFRTWAGGPGETELTRCGNAEIMIRKALRKNTYLDALDIEVFAQGSYRNLTNIPQESDVDIAVCLRTTSYYYELPTPAEAPLTYGIYSAAHQDFVEYKNQIQWALIDHFGETHVRRGNKAIEILENSYRIPADVVACWEFKWFYDAANPKAVHTGTKFIADDNTEIENWPKQHIEEGIAKNNRTSRRFKRLARILKRLQVRLVETGDMTKPLPSFFVECLVSNVPDDQFGRAQYVDDVRAVLAYLFNNTRNASDCSEWLEVNRIKRLFYVAQPWTVQQAHDFVSAAWDFIGFEN